jgi:hypothetical protein
MAEHEERMKRLLNAIFAVHQEATIDCETCSGQFDCLVEMARQGGDLRALWPAVEEHLNCCADCREEFNALMAIMQAENDGKLAGQ